jgi:hypothetical protein
MDKMVISKNFTSVVGDDQYNAPWEIVSGGFSYSVLKNDGILTYANSTETSGILYSENNGAINNAYVTSSGGSNYLVLDDTGSFLDVQHTKDVRAYVKTKTRIDELAGSVLWKRIYTYSKLRSECNCKITIPDALNNNYSFRLAASSVGKQDWVDADRVTYLGTIYECIVTHYSIDGMTNPGGGVFWSAVSPQPTGVTYPDWDSSPTKQYFIRHLSPINTNLNQSLPVIGSTPPLTIPFIVGYDNPLSEFNNMPPTAKGNVMYLELDQTADDKDFFIYEIMAYGVHERNAWT